MHQRRWHKLLVRLPVHICSLLGLCEAQQLGRNEAPGVNRAWSCSSSALPFLLLLVAWRTRIHKGHRS